jgi:hypothetical protein
MVNWTRRVPQDAQTALTRGVIVAAQSQSRCNILVRAIKDNQEN